MKYCSKLYTLYKKIMRGTIHYFTYSRMVKRKWYWIKLPNPNSWITQLNILKLICVCVCVQFLVTTRASKTDLKANCCPKLFKFSNPIIPFLPFLKSKDLNIHNWRTSMIIFLFNNNIYFWISYLADQLDLQLTDR